MRQPSPLAKMPKAVAILAAATAAACGQCPNLRWTDEFAAPGSGLARGTQRGTAAALRVFDHDASGPAAAELFVGGSFTTAGPLTTPGIARWDGRRWAAVGSGLQSSTGQPQVTGLTVHDPDGAGPLPASLIVAGDFDSAGGVPASGIAAWDGVQWSALGDGITPTFASVAMVDFDEDGPGPLPTSLMVSAGGPVQRWNGAAWSSLPNGANGAWALAVYDEDGPGPAAPALFAGVDYEPGLLKWDGSAWSVVGGGLRSALHTCAALTVIDEDGPGPARPVLYAGGSFALAGTTPASCIARWDGQEWSALGAGIPSQVEDITAIDYTGGSGPPVVYATAFSGDVYRWNPATPQWLNIGDSDGQIGIVVLSRLEAFDEDGSGPGLPALYYAAPALTMVAGVPSRGLARYACACYANCDGSAGATVLNVNDFVCFLSRFAARESYADCDQSGSLNVNDFVCFQSAFAAGCP